MKAISGGCKAELASCLCVLEANHDGLHRCVCQGSWDDEGTPRSMPQFPDEPELNELSNMLAVIFGMEP